MKSWAARAVSRVVAHQQPRKAWVAVPFAMFVVTAANAQVVRGVVAERDSREMLVGVLVTLERLDAPRGADTARTLSALTSPAGVYGLRAPGPGRYRLHAKRIGVVRFTSEAFTLSGSETRTLDIVLERASHALPRVNIITESRCALGSERIAALWDEARTALVSARVSERERLFQGSIYRYARTLEPRTLRILGESRGEVTGLIERPFSSESGDQLSDLGYWRPDADTLVFHAPDAEALLSDSFLCDHRFGVVNGGGQRAGMVGLTFEPEPGRRIADVEGTIWLDGDSWELRLVEYTYTRLPTTAIRAGVGGEVRFARLPNGAWLVRRWFVRMPEFPGGRVSGAAPVLNLAEEGGNVFAGGVRFFRVPAVVAGVARDSLGRPVTGRVRLLGSPHATESDSFGRFSFDSLPAASYTLRLDLPGYEAMGFAAAEHPMAIEEGDTARVTLRAYRKHEMVGLLCRDTRRERESRGTMRLRFVDEHTNAPLPRLPVLLSWLDNVPRGEMINFTIPGDGIFGPGSIRGITNGLGEVVFCNVPAAVQLLLRLPADRGSGGRVLTTFRLHKGEVTSQTVRLDIAR